MLSTVITVMLVALALASTFSAGLELQGEFDSHVVLRALAVNVVLLPLAATTLTAWLDLSAAGQLSLWLVALAPGGASSPLLARSAGAPGPTTGLTYLALSVTSAVLVPFGLWLLNLPLPLWAVGAAAFVQLVPLAGGAAVARRAARASQWAARLRSVGNALLFGVVGLLAVDRGPSLATLGGPTLIALAALGVVTLTLGAWVGVPRRGFAVLTVVRNLTLALLVCEAVAPGGAATLGVAAYGLLMYAIAGALVLAPRSHLR